LRSDRHGAHPDLHAFPTRRSSDLIDEFIAAQRRILSHCRKMGERFAILDPPASLTTPDQIRTWQARIADPQLSRFGAIYYPWVSVTLDSTSGPAHFIPPCGPITGSTARNDRLA